MSDTTSIVVSPVDRISVRNIRKNQKENSKTAQSRAAALLQSHPHFRGRERWVQCRYLNRRLYLTGIVPSYYLKQLAQEAVRELEDVDYIVNQIEVVSPICQGDRPS